MKRTSHTRRLWPALLGWLCLVAGAGWPVARQAFAGSAQDREVVRFVRDPDAAPDFKLDRLDGKPLRLSDAHGKVVLLNFWATWCGPCHALEPLFANVAADFRGSPDALFLSANCDEDETLVAPYLLKDKLATEVVLADGLERLFSVDSFPTVIVIDRQGKIAFRSEGFQPDTFERDLSSALRNALDKTDTTP